MIHPYNDYVLIKPITPAKGNDNLPDRANNKAFSAGIVMATGTDMPTNIPSGTMVHYKTSSYHIEVEDEGQKYLYVKVSELLGKITST